MNKKTAPEERYVKTLHIAPKERTKKEYHRVTNILLLKSKSAYPIKQTPEGLYVCKTSGMNKKTAPEERYVKHYISLLRNKNHKAKMHIQQNQPRRGYMFVRQTE